MSTPKSKLFNLNASLTKHNIGEHLDTESLCALSRTCTQYRDLFKNKRDDRKKAIELLFCVVNINESRKKRILELLAEPQLEIESSLLLRVKGKELAFSKTRQRMVCKREWNCSALEAAAKCGDNFLVQLFVTKIPEHQRLQALHQLQGIRAQQTTIEPGSYLCGFPALRAAYQEFLDHHATSLDLRYLNRLWGYVGEAQKNLSAFILQVFCTPKPHVPMPDFTEEPPRACILWDNSELDLEMIGHKLDFALYKGWVMDSNNARPAVAYGPWTNVRVADDFQAIDTLYEMIPAELDKIIQSLLSAKRVFSAKTME